MVNFFTSTYPKNVCKIPHKIGVHNSPHCFSIIKGKFVPNDIHNKMPVQSIKASKEKIVDSLKMSEPSSSQNEKGNLFKKTQYEDDEHKKKMEKPEL